MSEQLQCVVVTPEQTELDVASESVILPMFDGELGILKGHSPLVGRLGYGMLRVRTEGKLTSYFIEGGFAQVAGDVVSILTDKLTDSSEVTSQAAAEAMKEALALPTDDIEMKAIRDKAIARARAMARCAA